MSDLLRTNGYRLVTVGSVATLLRPALLLKAGFVLALLATAAICLLPLGLFDITPDRVWTTLLDPAQASRDETLIVWTLRVPRILLALMVGAMLGVAGASMQSVTRNGLADPGLIGVTEGATIVVLGIVAFAPTLALEWRPVAAMAGSVIVALVVMAISRNLSSVRFVLIGIGVSYFLSAGVSLFITKAKIEDAQGILIWLSGSLNMATWASIGVALPWMLAGIGLSLLTARAADAAQLGDAAARGLGVRINRLSLAQVAAPVMLTAASVAAVGNLGFVGLIAPHIARLVIGPNQTALLWGSAIFGAWLVLIGDSIGRLTFAPLQIPAGIVMAVLGVPFFLLLLWQRRDAL
jgi:iron complex transport system permease protein